MSYSYFRRKITPGQTVQVGFDNSAQFDAVHNKTQELKVNSEHSSVSLWLLATAAILVIVIIYILLKKNQTRAHK